MGLTSVQGPNTLRFVLPHLLQPGKNRSRHLTCNYPAVEPFDAFHESSKIFRGELLGEGAGNRQ